MKKFLSLLVVATGILFFVSSLAAEAKSANEYYQIEYNQCYFGGFAYGGGGIWDSDPQNESGNPSIASISVTFDVRAYNNTTGTLIAENTTVPVSTPVRFEVDLQNNTNISWFVTGTDLDSPYGNWTNAAPYNYPFQYNASCGGGGESRKEAFVTRPVINFNHSGSTASMSCNSNGSLCTVTGGGTLATSATFSPISMGFGGDGIAGFPGYEGPRGRTFNYGPIISYPINVAPPANQAPNPPSIGGPTTGNPNQLYTFTFQATDPDGGTIRYGIDWDNNGSVDQWVPGSGYVASNTVQSAAQIWSTEGNKTFKALTQDNSGATSGWTSYAIILNPIPAPVLTANLTINGSDGPVSVASGSSLSLSWISSNTTSCTAWGSGWSAGGAVAINGSATTTANQSDTYILQCTNGSTTVTDMVQVNLTNFLKVCQSSCSSGILRGNTSGSGSFTLARGGSQSLVTCFNPSAGCSEASGDVTGSTSWSEGGSNVVSLGGTSPKVVTGDNSGTESVSASYSGQTASTNVTVTCLPTVSCSNAPNTGNYCQNQSFNVDNGCGATITCNGTKTCDYNWKEVAP